MQKLFLFLVLVALCQNEILSQKLDSVNIDKHPLLSDRYAVKLGFFVNLKSVSLNVNGNLPSDPIDFGQTLGLSRQENTLDLNFAWRFSKDKKWIFGFEFFTVRNSQTAVLEDQIKWNNTIFPAGVILATGFDVDMYRIFFGRVISLGKKHELSGGLGIHTMNIKSFAEATGYIGYNDFELDKNRKNVQALAPVPNIGFRYLYAPNLR